MDSRFRGNDNMWSDAFLSFFLLAFYETHILQVLHAQTLRKPCKFTVKSTIRCRKEIQHDSAESHTKVSP